MIHRIPISHLAAAAKHRPVGYYDEVIRGGRVEMGVLFLEANVYDELQRKYSPATKIIVRPGDLFATVIRKITGLGPCPKSCREHIIQMNNWGWWKCWHNRRVIASWLTKEACNRGHAITDSVTLGLLRAAFMELGKANKIDNRKS